MCNAVTQPVLKNCLSKEWLLLAIHPEERVLPFSDTEANLSLDFFQKRGKTKRIFADI